MSVKMNNQTLCPICEEGWLQGHTEKVEVEFGGRMVELDSHYSICDCCGSEQATEYQVWRNKQNMLALRGLK